MSVAGLWNPDCAARGAGIRIPKTPNDAPRALEPAELPPSEVGKVDFFKLLVWDLVLNAVRGRGVEGARGAWGTDWASAARTF